MLYSGCMHINVCIGCCNMALVYSLCDLHNVQRFVFMAYCPSRHSRTSWTCCSRPLTARKTASRRRRQRTNNWSVPAVVLKGLQYCWRSVCEGIGLQYCWRSVCEGIGLQYCWHSVCEGIGLQYCWRSVCEGIGSGTVATSVDAPFYLSLTMYQQFELMCECDC